MTAEYIWFKGGRPTKHTLEESGERPLKVFLSGGVKIRYIYHTNGNVWIKSYYKNGKQHRDGDKPADINYYHSNGKVKCEYYYKNGKLHRNGDKPSFISYNENGDVYYKEYYKNGIKYKTL